jgi:hypothetical protein
LTGLQSQGVIQVVFFSDRPPEGRVAVLFGGDAAEGIAAPDHMTLGEIGGLLPPGLGLLLPYLLE